MPKIGELVINLKANTASFASDMRKVSDISFSSAKNIEKSFAVIGTAALSAVGVAGAALTKFVIDAAGYGEQISLAAQKTAMSTEQISGLKFAAGQAGVEFESLQKSLVIFSKNVAGLENTNSKAAKAFAALGIEAKGADGHIRPIHELLLAVADRFSKTQDSAEKTAIAVSVFGRAGAALIPFLNEGSEGIARLEKQADLLGLTLDEKTAEAARQFNDSLDMMKGGLQGLEYKIGNATIPALNDLLVRVIALEEEGHVFGKSWLKDFGVGATVALSALPDAFADLVNWNGKATQSLADWASGEAWANRQGEGLTARIIDLQEAFKLLGANRTEPPPIIDPKGHKAAKAATDELADSVSNLILELQKEFETFGMTSEQIKLYEMRAKGADTGELALAQHIVDSTKAKQDAHEATLALEKSTEDYRQELVQFAVGVYNDLATPAELATGKIDKLNEVFRSGLVDTNTYHAALSKLQDDLDFKRWEVEGKAVDDLSGKMRDAREAARQFADVVERGFENLIFSGRGFREVLAGIFEDLGRMILRAALLRPLENFFSGLFGGLGGGLFGGGLTALAGGGPVSSSLPYVVGERGPELFVPDVSGSIVPNDRLGGTAVVNNYNIDARGADPSVDFRIARALRQTYRASVAGAQAATRDSALRRGA